MIKFDEVKQKVETFTENIKLLIKSWKQQQQ